MRTKQGFIPLVVLLVVALGLIGGAAVGYGLREPIKKAIEGKTTDQQIQDAVDQSKAEEAAAATKFELEGVVTAIDTTASTVTVHVQSSTDSVKTLRLTDVPVVVAATAKISFGDKKNLKVGDILLNSKVHLSGTITNGILTATSIEVQKEEAATPAPEVKTTHFEVEGVVKAVAADNLTVTVSSANKAAKDKKSQDVTIKVASSTVFEKSDANIALTDIQAGDKVNVEGVIDNNTYTAAKIEVNVAEHASEIKPTSSPTTATPRATETPEVQSSNTPDTHGDNSSGGGDNNSGRD